MEVFAPFLTQLAAGAISASIVALILNKLSIGPVGNILAGMTGGGIAGKLFAMIGGAGIAGLVTDVVSGAVGGGALMVIVGLLRNRAER